MAPELMERLRAQLPGRGFAAVEMLIGGATTREVTERMKMSHTSLAEWIRLAEEYSGVTIRRPKGYRPPHKKRAPMGSLKRAAPIAAPPQKRRDGCARCGLRGKHECLRGEDFTRSGAPSAGFGFRGRMLSDE
jgi:hypothetical protein